MKRLILAALAAALAAPASAQVQPGARVTNVSGVPDPRGSADVSSSTVWLAPFRGDQEPVYYQGAWVSVRVSTSLTDTVGQPLSSPYWTGGSQFDLFVTTQDGVTPFFCSGHAPWPNPNATDAARGLVMINGVWVNGAAMLCDGTTSSYACPLYQCTHVGSINPPTSGGSGGSSIPVNIGSTYPDFSSQNNLTLNTTAAILAGDLVTAEVAINTNSGLTTTGFSDCVGNTYLPAVTTGPWGSGSASEVSQWYAQNALPAPSGCPMKATFSGSSTGSFNAAAIMVQRTPGMASTGVLDQIKSAIGSSVPGVSMTTAALSQPGEVAIGAAWSGTGAVSYASPGGWSGLASPTNVDNGHAAADYLATAATSPVTYGPTFGASNSRVGGVVATYKVAPAPPTTAQIGFQAADGQNRRVDFSNRYNALPLTLNVLSSFNPSAPPVCLDANSQCWHPSNQYPAWVAFNNDARNSAVVFLTESERVDSVYSQTGYVNDSTGAGGFITNVGWDGNACGFWGNFGVDGPATFAGGTGPTARCPKDAVIGVHTATQFAAAANNLSGGVTLRGGYNPAAAPGAHYSIEYSNLMTVTYPF